MQSLRTKKTSAQPRLRKQNATRGESRDARKSRVGDKIKKRMSMRYADISSPTAIGAPAVPSLPPGAKSLNYLDYSYNDDAYEDASTLNDTRSDRRVVDLKELQQDGFDPDAYLKVKLANSTEAELKSLQSSLEASKAATATDLQRNVFKNYEEFVLISKEISTLENDMLELKESLSEWKSMPSLLNIDDASSSTTDRRRANRSSVADLAKLYATQLSALYTMIEGSSKYVPAVPGRHIVAEIDNFWALNAATYKVEYAVHFVLLDDSLLVAKRRKRRTGEAGKLVAERCWPLNDISILDMKDTQDVTHAVKIRRGKESLVYRCDKMSEKKSLLSSFKSASEELATRKRKEREGEHERRRSMWAAGDRMSMYTGGGRESMAPVPALPSYLVNDAAGSKEQSEWDAKWIGDFTDELAVAIALRQWDEAAALVEKGNARLSSMPALSTKFTPLVFSLKSSLLHALSDSSLRKTSVIHLTSLLLQLREGTAARGAFLAARTELLRKRTRMIGFEGEISVYISELALVTFTSIKHTADWYLASFKENDMASGLIQWAKDQLEMFAKMFKRQVYGNEVDSKDVQDSLQVTRAQSKRLLHDIGLDFSHLIDQLVELPGQPPRAPTPAPATAEPDLPLPPTPLSATSPALAIPIPRLPVDMDRPPSRTRPRPPRSPAPPASPAPPPRSRDRLKSTADRPPSAASTPRRDNFM